MRVLVTGATGYVGGALLDPLREAGHDVRAFARDPSRLPAGVPAVGGDAVTGEGLDAALAGVDVAYYLIHSMETTGDGAAFAEREARAAERFARAACRAGLRRAVYLGGPLPADGERSPHLASRLAVERALREGAGELVALRASIVVGARSRSFRLLVRLVERLPALPLPPWREHRTAPVDERDLLAMLVAAADAPLPPGATTLDAAGPDVLTFGEIVRRIAEHMLVGRVGVELPWSGGAVTERAVAAVADEDPALVRALMGSLGGDLVGGAEPAAAALGVRLHSFDAAVEHALARWERVEPLAAR